MTGWDLPRVIDGMPHDVYLKDPVPGGSLSSSGARLLVSQCPAKFDYRRRHPDLRSKNKKEFDLGTAAHRLLLGAGPDLVVIDAPDYRTKDARLERDGAYQRGETPVLQAQLDMAEEMVTACRQDPVAGPLVAEGTGTPEQSLFWTDSPSGVACRARLDWLSRLRTADNKLVVIDYKTTSRTASPDAFVRTIRDRGYHMQGAWYIDAVLGCGLATDAVFLFIVQETEPPFIVTVFELHPITGLWVGRELNDHARKVYAKCAREDRWPAYSDNIVTADLPDWEIRKMENIIGADPLRGMT